LKNIGKTSAIAQAWLWALCAAFVLAGCQGTRMAYSSAKSVDEKAYVVVEHYAALVREAANLAQNPSTPAKAVEAMKKADARVSPVIMRVRDLRKAYSVSSTPENAESLGIAVDEAMVDLSTMVEAVNEARGDTP